MDKALFEFDCEKYERKDVESFSREHCERLCNIDEDSVTKYDLDYTSLEELLNEDSLNTSNCWYRLFMESPTSQLTDEIKALFEEFETDMLPISQFELENQGVKLDYIVLGDNKEVQFWSGNPIEDKHAEEILPTEEEKLQLLKEIFDLY